MFENGSYLRRRKRFKVLKQQQQQQSDDEKITMIAKPLAKTSFFIDNLLASDTSTNTSFATSTSSNAENSYPPMQLLHGADFDLLRQLVLFSDARQQPTPTHW